MPAYNPPPQVLFSPVTNYYQGKAIRAQQAMAEKELDTYDQKLALNERRVAAQEQNAQTNENMVEQRIKEYEYKVGEEASKRTAWDLYHTVSEVNSGVQNGQYSEEKALRLAVPKLLDYADSLPDAAKDEADKIRAAIQDRDGLTLEEWQEIGSGAEKGAGYYGFIGKEENVVLADGAELYGPDRKLKASNPRDFPPDSNKTTFDPPNTSEIETALKIVKKELDLDSRFNEPAAMWLANEVRNIQERSGESYDVAVAMALAKMKAKITKEPDMLSGSDDALNYNAETLKANEYLVRGEVWVKEPDGSIHRKNP